MAQDRKRIGFRCAVCNVRMSRGKGPKPIVCSKRSCRKAWVKTHITLDRPPLAWELRAQDNLLMSQNPDAWDDYFDIE